MSAYISLAPIGRIAFKLDIVNFTEKSVDKTPNLVKTGQKLIVAGDIKSPQNRSLRVKGYQAVGLAEEVKTLRERATLTTVYVHCVSCSLWPQPTFNRCHIRRHEAAVNLVHAVKAVVMPPAPVLPMKIVSISGAVFFLSSSLTTSLIAY